MTVGIDVIPPFSNLAVAYMVRIDVLVLLPDYSWESNKHRVWRRQRSMSHMRLAAVELCTCCRSPDYSNQHLEMVVIMLCGCVKVFGLPLSQNIFIDTYFYFKEIQDPCIVKIQPGVPHPRTLNE